MWKCDEANVFGSSAGGTPASGTESDAFLARSASASPAPGRALPVPGRIGTESSHPPTSKPCPRLRVCDRSHAHTCILRVCAVLGSRPKPQRTQVTSFMGVRCSFT